MLIAIPRNPQMPPPHETLDQGSCWLAHPRLVFCTSSKTAARLGDETPHFSSLGRPRRGACWPRDAEAVRPCSKGVMLACSGVAGGGKEKEASALGRSEE